MFATSMTAFPFGPGDSCEFRIAERDACLTGVPRVKILISGSPHQLRTARIQSVHDTGAAVGATGGVALLHSCRCAVGVCNWCYWCVELPGNCTNFTNYKKHIVCQFSPSPSPSFDMCNGCGWWDINSPVGEICLPVLEKGPLDLPLPPWRFSQAISSFPTCQGDTRSPWISFHPWMMKDGACKCDCRWRGDGVPTHCRRFFSAIKTDRSRLGRNLYTSAIEPPFARATLGSTTQ